MQFSTLNTAITVLAISSQIASALPVGTNLDQSIVASTDAPTATSTDAASFAATTGTSALAAASSEISPSDYAKLVEVLAALNGTSNGTATAGANGDDIQDKGIFGTLLMGGFRLFSGLFGGLSSGSSNKNTN